MWREHNWIKSASVSHQRPPSQPSHEGQETIGARLGFVRNSQTNSKKNKTKLYFRSGQDHIWETLMDSATASLSSVLLTDAPQLVFSERCRCLYTTWFGKIFSQESVNFKVGKIFSNLHKEEHFKEERIIFLLFIEWGDFPASICQ